MAGVDGSIAIGSPLSAGLTPSTSSSSISSLSSFSLVPPQTLMRNGFDTLSFSSPSNPTFAANQFSATSPTSLYVNNLSAAIIESDLHDLFSLYGGSNLFIQHFNMRLSHERSPR